MSEYSSLKATINANIKANNNHEITGSIMNSVLNAMVNSLGAGYQFIGVATPTNPGSAQTPDYKCFYIATTPGTYTNLGGLVMADGEVAILKYDTSWTKEVTGIATAESVSQLGQFIEIAPLIDREGNYITTEDLNAETEQYLRLTDGIIVTGSAYYGISDIIPCENIPKFYYSGRIATPSVVALACFYDENKQFISSVQAPSANVLDKYEVTTPTGAKFVRFCTYYKTAGDVSFVKYGVLGNPTPQTFRELIAQAEQITTIGHHINILCNSFIGKNGEKLKLSQITVSNGVWLGLSGTEAGNASIGTTDYIYVGRIPSFVVRYYNKAPSVVALACFYDENKQFISSVKASSTNIIAEQLVVVPSGAKYVRACSYYDNKNFEFEITTPFNSPDVNRDWLGELDKKLQGIPINNPLDNYCNIGMFEKFAVIGDSYASGEIWDSTPSLLIDNFALSWGQIIARRNGNQCLNLSAGGLTAKTWLTSERGLALLNSSDAQQLYMCALGLNDASHGLTIGTIDDIHDGAPSQNPDTFFGNYGRIIEAVKAKAPEAKIVFITTFRNTDSFANINTAIEEIAKHYNVPCLITRDDAMMGSDYYLNNLVGSHPTAALYSAMAVGYEKLMSKAMLDNPSYFNNYIG